MKTVLMLDVQSGCFQVFFFFNAKKERRRKRVSRALTGYLASFRVDTLVVTWCTAVVSHLVVSALSFSKVTAATTTATATTILLVTPM